MHEFGTRARAKMLASDRYGLLLLLIVVSLFAGTLSIGRGGNLVRAIVLGSTFLFALQASGVSRRERAIAMGFVVLILALSLPFVHGSRVDRGIASASNLLLIVGVLGAIVRRVGTHPVVSGATIAAALCVYLLLGLAFAAMYGLVGAIDTGPVFSGAGLALAGDGSELQRVYFSFTTLTTVGFGDIVPASDLTRMLAITQAFTGQLYLVTVLALLVGNLGNVRPAKRGITPDTVATADMDAGGRPEPGAGTDTETE